MRRTPLPPEATMEPCDPCVQLRARCKVQDQIIAALMERMGTNKIIVTVDPNPSVHYRTTASDALEVTSD